MKYDPCPICDTDMEERRINKQHTDDYNSTILILECPKCYFQLIQESYSDRKETLDITLIEMNEWIRAINKRRLIESSN